MIDAEALAEVRALGLRSDLLVMGGLGEVALHPDRIVLRTPAEPAYWYGNMVIFRGSEIAAEAQVARFHADFPQARHVSLAWDAPGMTVGAEHAPFSRLGFNVDQEDVLTLTGPLQPAPNPDGIDIRPIRSETEWAQVIALQLEASLEEGYERTSHEAYLRKRNSGRRQQIAEGWGCWFGAFDGAQLVGEFGIFAGAGLARFQSVQTRPSHRRRGICAAMVCAGVNWAARTAPEAMPIIVTLAESAAGRIYRRCGFALAERQVVAIRPPAGART